MTQDLGLSCKELVELVTAYDEGVLPVDERARFDEHLAECPDCVEYLAQFRRTVAAIGLAAPELEGTPPISDLLRVFRDWKRGLDGGVAGSC
jgi:anti-sigma factor RsiW